MFSGKAAIFWKQRLVAYCHGFQTVGGVFRIENIEGVGSTRV